MSSSLLRRGAMIVLAVCVTSAVALKVRADDRPAAQIVAEINTVEMPKIPEDRTNQKAIQKFITDRQKAMETKANLIGDLYKAYPDAPELEKLLPERWSARMMPDAAAKETKAEIDRVLATSKNEKLKAEASFTKVVFAFRKAGRNPKIDEMMPVFEEFFAKYPKDPRGAMVLSSLAQMTTDDTKKTDLMKRLEKDYPDSPAVKGLAGERRQREGLNKPFNIEFTEAIKGSQISMATLKGKVVVIDFWATWCGPCVAEMPNMKKLYAEYKEKGVEFIGVSLDQPKEQGGLDKLKEYVDSNKIEWPQYYQGNGWESEFSMSWGINSIPAVFLIDANGNLVSTQARGKLEELIPKYLDEAKGKKSASNN